MPSVWLPRISNPGAGTELERQRRRQGAWRRAGMGEEDSDRRVTKFNDSRALPRNGCVRTKGEDVRPALPVPVPPLPLPARDLPEAVSESINGDDNQTRVTGLLKALSTPFL